MNVRILVRVLTSVSCVIALGTSPLPACAQQQPVATSLSSTELRAILENQPDYSAEAVRWDPRGKGEVSAGRVFRSGNLYRFDPGKGVLTQEDESNFELLRPGTRAVFRYGPDLDSLTVFLIQDKQRRYYELTPNDDDIMEVYPLIVLHPHDSFLRSALLDKRKDALTYIGETMVDRHPCVKFASDYEGHSGHITYFAAKDLENLVIRIEWETSGDGNLIEMFPTKGTTILRNVKLEASAKLFAIPPGFAKIDHAKTAAEAKAREEAERQARLRSLESAPKYRGITVDPPVVRPGKTAELAALYSLASSEPKPTYVWTCDAGHIVGSGAKVEFDASGLAEGEYGVTVELTDEYGHAPVGGRVVLKVRDAAHDLSDVQTSFPKTGFDQVFCAVDDGAGGWFVGGILAGGHRPGERNIMHLMPNGVIDTNFAADAGLSVIKALVRYDQVLYVVTPSTNYSGILAFDVKTGRRLSWDPRIEGSVETIALAGRTLYIGGSLKSVGGVARPNLAAIDVVTAKVLRWNPAPDSTVSTLAVAGNRLLVVGEFMNIAGKKRATMVSFDVKSGKLLGMDIYMYPKPSSISAVGDVVYYTNGMQAGALDIASGRSLNWNPKIGGRATKIAATRDTVYLAGDFSTIDGKTRVRMAAFDATTGELTNWDPEADSWSNVIVPLGDQIFVGGYFQSIGRQRRSKFAILDAKTGDALSAEGSQ